MKSRARMLAATTAAVALLLAACTSSGGDEFVEEDLTLFHVTYVTAFGAFGRDAFAWVAQENGYFAEVGLEVDVQPGAGTGPNLQALEAGQADFAALDMSGAIIEAGNGNHTNFQVIAAIHQSTLLSIISLDGYDITGPQDLEGRTLATATASVSDLLFPAYAAAAGIDQDQVELVYADPPALAGLLAAGEVDALSTFLIGQRGIEVAAEGTPAVILPYSEFLPDLFGNAIIASSSMIEENPDVVEGFRDAMLRALEWSVQNPEEAAQILNDHTDSAVDAAIGEITSMTPAVRAAGIVGVMDPAQVARAITLLQGAGLIPPGLRPDKLVAWDLALVHGAAA
jgi:NitT/TauT family transport system substrate-binding protein